MTRTHLSGGQVNQSGHEIEYVFLVKSLRFAAHEEGFLLPIIFIL